MGRTNSPEPMDFAALELDTVVRMSVEEWEAHKAFYRLTVQQRDRAWRTIENDAGAPEGELARLYAVESAAIKVLGTMPRRNGKPSSFTLATFPAIEELDATLQQTEED